MPQFIEVVKLIAVLFAVIVGYTLTGIANNCLVKNEKFDFIILIKGLAKTLTACLGLIIVAYVCTLIDLSGLGFQPQTAITSGILVYSAKLIRNAFGLLGLSKYGKEEDNTDINSNMIISNISQNPDDKIELFTEEDANNYIEENVTDNDDDFVDIDIHGDSVEEDKNNFKPDPNAVG